MHATADHFVGPGVPKYPPVFNRCSGCDLDGGDLSKARRRSQQERADRARRQESNRSHGCHVRFLQLTVHINVLHAEPATVTVTLHPYQEINRRKEKGGAKTFGSSFLHSPVDLLGRYGSGGVKVVEMNVGPTSDAAECPARPPLSSTRRCQVEPRAPSRYEW